jgi:PIN domain nuclease of toxin-antitoxin system
MRLLLDTHALLWWATNDAALPSPSRRRISEARSEVLVSAASAWEIATKTRLGRLPSALQLVDDFEGFLVRQDFEALAITVDHGLRAGLLPGYHKDPFDRMLIAQAQAENLAIISNDQVFDQYGVRRLW